MGKWTDIFIGDDKRKENRKKRIAANKKKKTKSTKQKMINKKQLGYKAVKAQRKKKRMLEDAGK